MRSVARFFMRETVFTVSLAAALCSMIFVRPDAGYFSYVDWNVLMLLFSLMAVVAGLKKSGVFDLVSRALMARAGGMRRLALILTVACFFVSMLVTNDVALMTFVPLTVGMLAVVAPWETILIVCLETVAANLGSMATPIGNPQNLFLYAHYDMPMGEFLRAVMPISGASLLLILISCLLVRRRGLTAKAEGAAMKLPKGPLILYALLFLLCVLAVLRVIPKWVCLAGVVIALLAFARGIFREIDYALLGTFICFFVFVGNLARIGAVRAALESVVGGRELEVGILASQAISNVPAAIMLSGFTHDAFSLMRGVDIGGLGTLVASLASLIAFRLYMKAPGAKAGKFLLCFSAMNLAFLAALYGLAKII